MSTIKSNPARGIRLTHAFRVGFAKAYCGHPPNPPEGWVGRACAELVAFLDGYGAGMREADADRARLEEMRASRSST